MSTQALWEEFAQAEANKKLCELKERGIREERKLLEGPNAYFYYYSGDTDMGAAYTRLMEQESQSYALKLQKEGYEWQKKQAEGYLKLLGAKPDRAQLEYGLYTGTLTVQDASYEELYTQRSSLQLQEQQAEWQKKSLEYQYQLEQLGDSEFVEQYSALVLEKETVKLQREQLDAQIQLLFGLAAPAPGLGILP